MTTPWGSDLDEAVDRMFLKARSYNGWQAEDVSDDMLRHIYDLMRWGPTSMNGNPLRILFLRSPEKKEQLAGMMVGSNGDKVRSAPVAAVLAYDTRFHEKMDRLFPHDPKSRAWLEADDAAREETAFRNSSMQAGYFILTARLLGIDCGPMSGVYKDRVDAAFFPDGRCRTNLVCALGRGDPSYRLFERNPRPGFDEVCQIV
ncbi:putative malonic semialdehyde reductase RutE [Sphingobium jiangsuense]|uniref:3-hydroxypropanoate dehydrogenase n=1 Tax=Sphingobium jiangsuense TaxID=870476 RepID=A0A7W6FNC7_9SPHN|nr:malonic semialdehyde reductase [Sphingobium jiangsuense]MBB3924387.1 3-hydroxypropanoate dehydrogenase [Sphingobium jiangsuense]GLT00702.1 putative malonic semialdehyde reductase RutE [Sphingobium jiangsuense]